MAENITLEDLINPAATTATADAQNTPEESTVKEVNIEDIKPYKEPVNVIEENTKALYGELDAAIEKEMEKITEFQNKIIEEEYEKQLDDDNYGEGGTEVVDTLKFDETTETSATVEPKNIDLSLDDDDFFKDLDEDEDDINDEETDEQIKEIKASIKEKIVPVVKAIDLTTFKIGKKPVSITKLLSMETPNSNVADWILYSAKKPFSISEFSGTEIEKLNPSNSSRNRLNTYKDIYNIIYKHIVDANKLEFEAWLKTIKFFDINHIYFAIYKACFAGTNSVPYSCPECNKMFMVDLEFEQMIKYASDEVKEEVARILAGDTTSASDEYDVILKQVSDNIVIGLKEPSAYEVIFETSSLPQDFTEKYKELLGLMSYIDGIYVINAETNTLDPVDTKPDPNNMVKTAMKKIKIYYEIINSLTSDQYYQLTSFIKEINDNAEKVSYILPEVTCPKCGKVIPEETKTPDSLLFTRHQLAAIANI